MMAQTISHYRILEKLGEGGMGVVYKAEDTRLQRTVALKFLPPTLLAGDEDRERFLREAQSAAALSHPNIATVFAIEEVEGQTFIVLEYIDGQSLDRKIASGPLKFSEAIDIANQLCAALQAAHQKDIVHRDIKSPNIMVAGKSQVKILDFGLARLRGASRITRAGMTVGTMGYMSPEQLRGEAVDQRTDIWSAGVVLYEMVAGRLPFPGEYEQAISYQILNDQPEPLTAIRTGVPPELERIVFKMLAKDPAERYQHVEEIPVDLRGIRLQSGPKPTLTTQQVVPVRQHRRSWVWAAGGLVLGIAATLAAWKLSGSLEGSSGPRQEVQRWSIVVPDSIPIEPIESAPLGIGQPAVAISPDGSQIAFVVRSRAGIFLQIRPLNRYGSFRLPGTENAYFPFFSPNGRWIGFFAGNQLRKISVDGGAVTTLCEATNPRGAVWGEDDLIYFCDREGTRLLAVQSGGGAVTRVKASRPGSIGRFEYPKMLPGRQALVCASRGGLKVVSLIDGSEKQLAIPGTSPMYLSTGHLIYYYGGSLVATTFDAERQQVTGTPTPIVNGILAEAPHFGAHYAVARNGTLVYISGLTEVESRLVMADRRGGRRPLQFPPQLFGTYQLSPDGRRLVLLARVLGMDVWIYDLQEDTRTRVTTDGRSGSPIWSPDGKWILYATGEWGREQLVRETSDGSGRKEVITRAGGGSTFSLSPDGRYLAISASDTIAGSSVKVVDLQSSAEPVVVASTPANEWGPSFSRDGKYVAYVSDESGQYEVYVQPFPTDGRRWQVSTEGGEEPIWSGNGKELFYRRGLEWVAVEVTTSPGFAMKKSSVAIKGNYVNVSGRSYDVTADGSRFLVLERLDADVRLTEIRAVVNWQREVEEKVREH